MCTLLLLCQFVYLQKKTKQQREKYMENVLLFPYYINVCTYIFWLLLLRVARKGVHVFISYRIAYLERGLAHSKAVRVKRKPQQKNQWRNPN